VSQGRPKSSWRSGRRPLQNGRGRDQRKVDVLGVLVVSRQKTQRSDWCPRRHAQRTGEYASHAALGPASHLDPSRHLRFSARLLGQTVHEEQRHPTPTLSLPREGRPGDSPPAPARPLMGEGVVRVPARPGGQGGEGDHAG
jgi:hypothetical protein